MGNNKIGFNSLQRHTSNVADYDNVEGAFDGENSAEMKHRTTGDGMGKI